MTARKLATLLTDFDARPGEPARASRAPSQDASFYPTLADGPGGVLSVARREGYEAGLAKARAQAAVESEAAGRRAAAERAHWVESESRQLAVKFETAFAAIAAAVCDQLAVTLRPVVFDAVVRRAIDTMAREIRALLADGEAAVVKICGPEDLIAAIGAKLQDCAARIEFLQSPDADAVAVCNQTRIETRLAAWRSRLSSEAE